MATGMSKLTFYKHFKDLQELGLVTATRKIYSDALQGQSEKPDGQGAYRL
ncbi:MAG: hypothetical protein QXN83_01205 [Nitrososphaerales archaeon]